MKAMGNQLKKEREYVKMYLAIKVQDSVLYEKRKFYFKNS